jgi:protein-S-isoprenylcysteine O-methyltransferase Ste14
MQARNTQAETAAADVSALPPSATNTWINLVGLASFLITLYLLNEQTEISPLYAAIIAMASFAVPIVVLELIFLKTYRRASTGYDFSESQPYSAGRVIVKLLGFYVSIGLLGVVYAIIPEYNGGFYGYLLNVEKFGGYYARYWDFVKVLLPVLMIGAIPYFAIMEMWSTKHRDGNWQAGMMILGRFSELDGKPLWQHFLGWTVKGFFLPLMIMWTMDKMPFFMDLKYEILKNNFRIVGSHLFGGNIDPNQVMASFNDIFHVLNETVFAVDLSVVAIGYIMTVRLFDSHLRSAEPTFSGWVWAIVCYPPFWALISPLYFAYENDGVTWNSVFANHPTITIFWGSLIILLEALYSLASVQFGVRFSNLTHRGILTNGIYSLTKHPAYVAKNSSWWLVSMPFITADGLPPWVPIQSCILLLGVNMIYYMRARTEERHLSSDPVYVQYALAMNQRSIFRWLVPVFPFLKYKPQPKLVDLA